MEKIPLLSHHARLTIPYWLDFLRGSVKDLVTTHILPYFEKEEIRNEKVYPFLQEPDAKTRMIFGLITAFNAYSQSLYYEIPEYDPESGRRNTDVICEHCGNFQNGKCM